MFFSGLVISPKYNYLHIASYLTLRLSFATAIGENTPFNQAWIVQRACEVTGCV